MAENLKKNENDVAVMTRVRLARNINALPYPKKMSVPTARQVIEEVWDALKKSPQGSELTLFKTEEMNDILKRSLVERHLISAELASSNIPAAAAISADESVSVMINEEDHIRIQVFTRGLDAESAYIKAKEIEEYIGQELTFDYDNEFGFLTSCPTNIGTGLRASVMLHLPAITVSQRVSPLLKWAANLGMTVRGLYGEGSRASGALFQLSNQITLGVSETEIVSRFTAAACSLISEERRISAEVFDSDRFRITDKCLRSLGILKNAYMINSSEATDLISNVCMGVNLGIIKNIDTSALRDAMFSTLPANINLSEPDMSPQMRDVKRAQLLQEALAAKNE